MIKMVPLPVSILAGTAVSRGPEVAFLIYGQVVNTVAPEPCFSGVVNPVPIGILQDAVARTASI